MVPTSDYSSKNVKNCPSYEFENIFNWIIISVGLPIIIVVGYALIRLVKADHVTPIYVINLLLSDLLQLFTKPVFTMITYGIRVGSELQIFSAIVINTGFLASPFFMMAISLERYLVVGYPIWYRTRRSVRISIVVSVAAWLILTAFALIILYQLDKHLTKIYAVVFLLPFPFLVFFYVGTVRSLSRTINLPRTEKRRILGTLLMVLGIYCVLFLPYSFVHLFKELFNKSDSCYLEAIVFNLVDLSAIVDPVLYIFMRKDVRWIFKMSICCRGLMGVSDSSRTSEGYQEDSGALGSTQVEAVSSV
ncbi:proteinase-activated receptor 2-like isoform X2 [Arapaima gigas]